MSSLSTNLPFVNWGGSSICHLKADFVYITRGLSSLCQLPAYRNSGVHLCRYPHPRNFSPPSFTSLVAYTKSFLSQSNPIVKMNFLCWNQLLCKSFSSLNKKMEDATENNWVMTLRNCNKNLPYNFMRNSMFQFKRKITSVFQLF